MMIHLYLPLKVNSKRVVRFSGLGLVTKILEYPKAIAPAMASPKAADLPLPRAAVSDTVDLNVFSDTASINFRRALA
jgi:hypothetical protein